MGTRRDRGIRSFAVAAAGVTALLYVLIGLEVLFIGGSSSGRSADLLGFGLMAGGTFAVIAVLLALFPRRIVWIPVALLTLAVIAAYFGFAALREPPFAFWGLAVKGAQTALLGAVAWLALRRRDDYGGQPKPPRALSPAKV